MIRRGFSYLASAPLVLYCSLGVVLLVLGAVLLGRDALGAALRLTVLISILWFQERHLARSRSVAA